MKRKNIISGTAIAATFILMTVTLDLRTMTLQSFLAIAEAYKYYASVAFDQGQIAVFSDVANYAVEKSSTQGDTTIAGVAKEDVDAGAWGYFAKSSVARVRVTGNVYKAAPLRHSSTEATAEACPVGSSGVFAFAMTDKGEPSANEVYAMLLPSATTASAGAGDMLQSVYDTDADGKIDEGAVDLVGGNTFLPFEMRLGVPESNLGIIDFRQGRSSMRLYGSRKHLTAAGSTASELYLMIQLPSWFDGSFYSGTNIWIDVYRSDADNDSAVTLTVYDSSGDADDGVNGADIKPGSNAVWAQASDQLTETNYSPGEWLTLKVTVTLVDLNDEIRIGGGYIRLN